MQRTALWTGLNVIFHFTIGLGLALLMNQKIRFKGIYRSLIVLPWAIPSVITALTLETRVSRSVRFRQCDD
ncbi:MAG UNVERIFIED_CONTAM: hypothetical protein LVT10_07260 [Anaerolineae bacterium]